MPLERVNGVDLYYESTGEGVPLVLCHEFAGDHAGLGTPGPRSRPPLSGRRLELPGIPALGRSRRTPDAYSPDGLVADLLGLLDGLGLDRVHLAGLATGGNLVLNFANRPSEPGEEPHRGGGGGGFGGPGGVARGGGTVRGRYRPRRKPKASSRTLRTPRSGPSSGPRIRAASRSSSPECAASRRWGRSTSCARSSSGARPVFELAEGIRRLSMPILAMCGDQDAPAFELEPLHPGHRSPRRARGGADVRPHPELGGAGAVQPDRGLVPRRGRRRAVGDVARVTRKPR